MQNERYEQIPNISDDSDPEERPSRVQDCSWMRYSNARPKYTAGREIRIQSNSDSMNWLRNFLGLWFTSKFAIWIVDRNISGRLFEYHLWKMWTVDGIEFIRQENFSKQNEMVVYQMISIHITKGKCKNKYSIWMASPVQVTSED